jgi:hypothetical protein
MTPMAMLILMPSKPPQANPKTFGFEPPLLACSYLVRHMKAYHISLIANANYATVTAAVPAFTAPRTSEHPWWDRKRKLPYSLLVIQGINGHNQHAFMSTILLGSSLRFMVVRIACAHISEFRFASIWSSIEV